MKLQSLFNQTIGQSFSLSEIKTPVNFNETASRTRKLH